MKRTPPADSAPPSDEERWGSPRWQRRGLGTSQRKLASITHCQWAWTDSTAIRFHLDLGPRASRAAPAESRRAAAEERIRELPDVAVWI